MLSFISLNKRPKMLISSVNWKGMLPKNEMLLQRKCLAKAEVRLWSCRRILWLEMSHSILLPALKKPKVTCIFGHRLWAPRLGWLLICFRRSRWLTWHAISKQKEPGYYSSSNTYHFTCQKYICISSRKAVNYELKLFT